MTTFERTGSTSGNGRHHGNGKTDHLTLPGLDETLGGTWERAGRDGVHEWNDEDAARDPVAGASPVPGVPAALASAFSGYLDLRAGPVGRVVSSEKEPAGALG